MNEYPKNLKNGTKEEFLFHARMMKKEKEHRIGCFRNIIIFIILLVILGILAYLHSIGIF